MAYEAITYRASGEIERATFEEEPSLEWLQAQVGGYIERVPGLGVQVWCNEDGRMAGLPRNPHAAKLLGREIVGDFVVCDPPCK